MAAVPIVDGAGSSSSGCEEAHRPLLYAFDKAKVFVPPSRSDFCGECSQREFRAWKFHALVASGDVRALEHECTTYSFRCRLVAEPLWNGLGRKGCEPRDYLEQLLVCYARGVVQTVDEQGQSITVADVRSDMRHDSYPSLLPPNQHIVMPVAVPGGPTTVPITCFRPGEQVVFELVTSINHESYLARPVCLVTVSTRTLQVDIPGAERSAKCAVLNVVPDRFEHATPLEIAEFLGNREMKAAVVALAVEEAWRRRAMTFIGQLIKKRWTNQADFLRENSRDVDASNAITSAGSPPIHTNAATAAASNTSSGSAARQRRHGSSSSSITSSLPHFGHSWLLEVLQKLLQQEPSYGQRWFDFFSGGDSLTHLVSGNSALASESVFLHTKVHAIVPVACAGDLELLRILLKVPGATADWRWRCTQQICAADELEFRTGDEHKAIQKRKIRGLKVSNATQSTFCPSEFRSVLTLVCQLQPTSVEVVQLLLEAKASPVDCCPLYFAAQAGNSPVMKTLMSAKAPVDPNFGHTRPGFSPLFGAVEHGHNAAVKLLLDAKANPEPVRYDGSTPLYFACQEGMVEIVEMLLQAKSSVDREELEHGIPPLYIATSQNRVDVVKYLLQHKATVNALRSKSATSLVCAARKGQSHLQILQMLLAAKADPNISEPVNGFRMPGSPNEVLKERLPLQLAFRDLDDDRAILALVQAKSALWSESWSALLAAVSQNRPDVVRALMHAGANPVETCTFMSVSPNVAIPVRHTNPIRMAVESRAIGCLQEMAVVCHLHDSDRKTWRCDFDCGFCGTFAEVCPHERTCRLNPRRASRARSQDAQADTPVDSDSDEELPPSPPEDCEPVGAHLDLYRENVHFVAAQGENVDHAALTSHWLKITAGFSAMHFFAAAGDAAGLFRVLVGTWTHRQIPPGTARPWHFEDYRGFYKANPAGLSVQGVVELASKGKLLLHNYSDPTSLSTSAELTQQRFATFEHQKVKWLVAQAQAAWSPKVHSFFGPEHSLGVQEVLLCGRHAAPQNVPHQQVLDCVLRMLPRGWFEYDGLTPAGSRRRMRDATREIKRLQKCLALAKHSGPSTDAGAPSSCIVAEKPPPSRPKRPEDMDRRHAAHGNAGPETLKKRARLSRHAQ